jgi:N-acetylglutamate synthase-like GNAT family acetyltransferase
MHDETIPFVILEDLIIKTDVRSHGIGSSLMNWICDECHDLGFRQMFLESAIGNARAHELFHRHEFKPISVVMSRNI